MLSLVTDAEVAALEKEYNACIFKKDLEYELVWNSPITPVNIPTVFLDHLFKILYNRDINECEFKDGDKFNWNINNIVRQ